MHTTGRVGFRVVTHAPSSSAPVSQFRGYSSALVADAMGRFGFMDGEIRSRSGVAVCGPVVTIATRPGDNLMVHYALEIARPGDVLVVATGGNSTHAVFGEIMCHTALARGIAGIVIDGAIRDASAIAALHFPVFSRSVCIGSCDKDGPGEIGVPISCGGVAVQPGDIVVADNDGIAVVPRGDAAHVLAAVYEVADKERAHLAALRAGELSVPAVAARLRQCGILGEA
ncbi:MAG: RraA family protein [Gemmatimonadota bacterium]